jgi:ribosomal protein S18 acetylase RimI-like enzyme
MKIKEIRKFSNNLYEGFNKLIPQLTTAKKEIPQELLRRIIESENVHLFAAEEKGVLLGMLTLVIYPIPTDLRAVIEDVVVEATARGRGIGNKLIRSAIAMAKEQGVTSVNLTSNPNRKAANALYEKMGFNMRETNVYRFDI